ncbi:MAG: DUF4178 domain-containing protein [Azonexus sp.]|jgi:ribosomal protein S27E|nr:DUF4178 domain-containing protein [Azonexus sp.]
MGSEQQNNARQRFYRAPCPGCGAPVEFHSAQSTHAVCAYCRTTVARDGDTLKRVGRLAELFDDFSPLQIGATGRDGQRGFVLVGRLQYAYAEGRWTEWVTAFDDGGPNGILSEDNGAYVFAKAAAPAERIPAISTLALGKSMALGGQSYTVASIEQVTLASAQGELSRLPQLNRPFAVVELRNEQDQVLSLDYGSNPPAVWLGTPVQLADLQLRGLRDESVKNEQGRSFNCPQCGSPVTVQLEKAQSVTCPGCHSLIDIADGIGGELRHAQQKEAVRPLIPLGASGVLQDETWQVIGFQRRQGQAPDDDERFIWDEYLLYNKNKGFRFLVDASDGWSLVAPATGAPRLSGNLASYKGQSFRLEWAYRAETLYVAGEFYWQVERGQSTDNKDFRGGNKLLSLESSPHEQVWSYGEKIDSDLVARMFNIDPGKLRRGDALPVSDLLRDGGKVMGWIFVTMLLIVMLVSECRRDDGSSSVGSGGLGRGYGSYSSGGGHK